MTILFALFLFPCLVAERAGNPRLAALGVDASAVDAPLVAARPGGNMANGTDGRPDPEALLALARKEDTQSRVGKLRIFFGAAPGVGKTYSMG